MRGVAHEVIPGNDRGEIKKKERAREREKETLRPAPAGRNG